MDNERRKQRSQVRDEAIGYYLQALQARHNLKSVVIADAKGLVVAGLADNENTAALAAVAPYVAADRPCPSQAVLRAASSGEPIFIAELNIQATRCFMAWVGTRELDKAAAQEAMDRIFAAAA